ncbi:N-acetylmuramic acid 6-phosphate etherase [Nitratireductor sp. GCM10026969]|uniref:N-acetylmuramic acid 6-phosphate etherase n=1 Tax=Nitratireductor sp. GCM10026969 TaxID=3252645 RepID=UPI00361E9158
MQTESANPEYSDLERAGEARMLRVLLEGQQTAYAAVARALPDLEKVLAAMIARLRGSQGRIFYVGAGTSGRLAVLDGLELNTTFGWPPERLVLLLAGGDSLTLSNENAEDDTDSARLAIERAACGPDDVVLALAASGTTPYTLSAVRTARARHALVIAFANNADTPLLSAATHGVLLDTGPEVLAGSTRLAAGTSQKIVLNMLSTALMMRLGKVFRGQMVDMQASNAKLRRRAVAMLTGITGAGEAEAVNALEKTGYRVKPAILVVGGMEAEAAGAALARHGGDLHAVLNNRNTEPGDG